MQDFASKYFHIIILVLLKEPSSSSTREKYTVDVLKKKHNALLLNKVQSIITSSPEKYC